MKKFIRFLTPVSALALVCLTAVHCAKDDSDDQEATAPNTDEDNTNTSSSELITATNTFLTSLTASQKTAVNLEFNVTNAEYWSNLPIPMATRNGVAFSDLSEAQKTAALDMIKAAMGTGSYEFFTAVRLADDKLSTINSSNWGSGKYYIAVLGTPSDTDPWMLQVGGHHYGYNMVFHADAKSTTPLFQGIDPITWTDSGATYKPLETQRAAVEALAASVHSATGAVLPGLFDDVVMGPNGTGNHDTNYPQDYPTTNRGTAVSALSSAQKTLVKTAIEAWVNTAPSDVASTYLAAYETDAALNNTYIAIGENNVHAVDFSANPADASGKGSYLRIDGPRVWIEFVVQIGAFSTSSVHYHTLWRDKETDYGAEFK